MSQPNYGEVFTRRWIVEAMLDLVGYTIDRDLIPDLHPAFDNAFLGTPIADYENTPRHASFYERGLWHHRALLGAKHDTCLGEHTRPHRRAGEPTGHRCGGRIGGDTGTDRGRGA